MSRHNENDKVLIIVKKKEFSRTNTTIQNRSIRLNEHAFFNFNIIFMMKYANSSKYGVLFQIRRWSQILHSFDDLG